MSLKYLNIAVFEKNVTLMGVGGAVHVTSYFCTQPKQNKEVI